MPDIAVRRDAGAPSDRPRPPRGARGVGRRHRLQRPRAPPHAVRSVQEQTLRHLEVIVVDDCSTDGSAEAADVIAGQDPRVRVVRLPENSGGCSRPRNVGLDLARAPYVMFLDSDDVYDRHACKNLLLTAERTGADVVAGQVRRLLVTEGKEAAGSSGSTGGARSTAGSARTPSSSSTRCRRTSSTGATSWTGTRHQVPRGCALRGLVVLDQGLLPGRGHRRRAEHRLPVARRAGGGDRGPLDHPAALRDRQLPRPHRRAPHDGRLPARARRRGPQGGQGRQVHPARPASLPERPAPP